MTEFEEVYQTYFQDVYRYIRQLSGDEQTAEEVTSETFFKAMRSIGTFRGECDLRVWLCQIAKNTYYSYCKKNARTVSLDEEAAVEQPGTQNVEDEISRRETVRQTQEALHGLPEPYKEVFMWRAFADLSFKQIGQMFRKSDNWACVTYHRARAMIKSRMEGKGHEK